MRRVRFSLAVTVHKLDDARKDRRSIWMCVAADRERFQHRIRRTALVLDSILTAEHRLVMLLRSMELSD